MLGTDKLRDYLNKYKLKLPTQAAQIISNTDVIPFENFVSERNKDRVSPEALDLLKKMLLYDKNGRITPAEAMQHPYFAPIRKFIS